MCKIFDDLRKESELRGERRGELRGVATSVRNLMAETGWTAERAFDALRVPAEDRARYLALI